MTLNLTYRHFVYYRCNGIYGDTVHWTHEIDGTRNMVVYACPRTNRMVCENWDNCYTSTGIDEGYLDEFTLVDDVSEGNWSFLMQRLFQNGDIYCRTTYERLCS